MKCIEQNWSPFAIRPCVGSTQFSASPCDRLRALICKIKGMPLLLYSPIACCCGHASRCEFTKHSSCSCGSGNCVRLRVILNASSGGVRFASSREFSLSCFDSAFLTQTELGFGLSHIRSRMSCSLLCRRFEQRRKPHDSPGDPPPPVTLQYVASRTLTKQSSQQPPPSP